MAKIDCYHCEHFGTCKLEEEWNSAEKVFSPWAKNYQVLLNEIGAAVANQCRSFLPMKSKEGAAP